MKTQKRTAAEVLAGFEQSSSTHEKGVKSPDHPNSLIESLQRNIGKIVNVPITELNIKKNVRTMLDLKSQEFGALVDDIKAHGIRQNIAAELAISQDNNSFKLQVVYGQRRLLAAHAAGLDSIATLLLPPGSEGERIYAGLAENIMRAEMHPLDKAEGFYELLNDGWTKDRLSASFEKEKRTLNGFLRLARFPSAAKEIIKNHPDKFTTRMLFLKFLSRKWSSEQSLCQSLTEVVQTNSIKATKTPRTAPGKKVKQLEKLASAYFGIRSSVRGADEKGKLELHWNSAQEFILLLTALEKLPNPTK